MKRFHYLHYGLSAVLVFVGTKMLLADFYKIPTWVSLVLIVSILAVSMIASRLSKQNAMSLEAN
jgi:tellurite resistance protein TerC